MHFVPVFYDDVEQFRSACRDFGPGAAGISAYEHLDELAAGDDVVLQIAVCGTGQQEFVRGTVVWKRLLEDAHAGLPAAAGVRIREADRARFAALAARVDAVARSEGIAPAPVSV